MTYLRRLLLALALSAGLAPALAQVPAPVPALPDTERRTSYSISGTTCSCAVNFALFGDSTDFQNWVEVWLNGVQIQFNDATKGWAITTPSGSFATLARPVTNAILTFNSVQTGTVQIVGARRPRRTTQFNEATGVPTRNLNQAFTDVIAMMRETWDKTNDATGRTLMALPGETIANLPAAAARASSFICWDVTGLIPMACGPLNGQGNVVGPNSAVDGHIALVSGSTGLIIRDGGAIGTGDVTGPAGATANAFVLFNGATGKILKNGPTVIPLASGGTNNALTASNGGLAYSDAAGIQILAGTATAGQMAQSGASAAPIWSTATWPATTTINQLLWSSGTNTVAGLTTCNNGIIITSGGGVPSCSSTLPAAVQSGITQLGTIGAGIWNGTPITGPFITTNTVVNSNLAQAIGPTLKGNPTASTANLQDFAIQSLTNKPTPHANNDFLLLYDAAAGTFKSVTPGQLASGGTAGVSQLNTLTGSLNVVAGNSITVSASGASITVSAIPSIPGGRLTLVTGVPVMVSNQTAKGTLFYDCYKGNNLVPYSTGSADVVDTIAACEVSDVMVSAASAGQVVSGQLYDVWWVHSGANRICLAMSAAVGGGGGWASDTAGSNTARGTGYSQLDLTTRPYITNKNSITNCFNAATNYGPVSANQGTYLGTILATANGQTGMAFSATGAGGGNGILGVFNAYNQVPISAYEYDTTSTWAIASATWRKADANANNAISWVDGLQQSYVRGEYQVLTSSATGVSVIGCLNDWTSGAPTVTTSGAGGANGATLVSHCDALPQMGLHVMNALEASLNTTSVSFFGSGGGGSTSQSMQLRIELPM